MLTFNNFILKKTLITFIRHIKIIKVKANKDIDFFYGQ